mgnify:CR=1 FL=1
MYKLEWKLFDDKDAYGIRTIGDGSCLFHSIFFSLYEQYQVAEFEERQRMVIEFRKTISDNLTEDIYSKLLGGALCKTDLPEFSLDNMKNELNSKNSIGYGYIEYISNVIEKDIYILEASKETLYVSDESKYSCLGYRPSIILLYYEGHYETVGIIKQGELFTHYCHSYSLIEKLKEIQQHYEDRIKD